MRFVNRLLAALLALALAVAGVLLVVEVIAAGFNASPAIVHWHQWYQWARRTSWDTASVQIICIVIAAVGLLLLLVQLKPRKPRRLVIASEDTDAAFTRRGVAATVKSAVTDVDGISAAKVTVRRRKVTVAATTAGLAPYTAQSLSEPARTAAQSRLSDLELSPAPKLAVRVATRSR